MKKSFSEFLPHIFVLVLILLTLIYIANEERNIHIGRFGASKAISHPNETIHQRILEKFNPSAKTKKKPVKKKENLSTKSLSKKTFEVSMKDVNSRLKELYRKVGTLLSKFTLFEERLNDLEKKFTDLSSSDPQSQ